MARKSRIRSDRDVQGTQSKIAKGKANRRFKAATGDKGKVDSLGPIEGAPNGKGAILLPIGDNGPKPDRIKFHLDTVKGHQGRVAAAQRKLTNAYQAAEKEGLDKAAIKVALAAKNKDPLELRSHYAQLGAMFDVADVPVQLGLLNSSAVCREAQVFDECFKAGEAGKEMPDKWPASTPLGQIALEAYSAGQLATSRRSVEQMKGSKGSDEDADDEDPEDDGPRTDQHEDEQRAPH